jgi:hypothetical protein
VVSNGSAVNIFDSRLKTFESYPLSRTPLNLLLAREVRLDRGVRITGVRKLADGFTINAVDAKRQTLGRIALDFSNAPALTGWTVTDVKGGQTRVRLVDFEKTSGLDPKLFVLTDPQGAGSASRSCIYSSDAAEMRQFHNMQDVNAIVLDLDSGRGRFNTHGEERPTRSSQPCRTYPLPAAA